MSSTDSYYSNLLIMQYNGKPKAKATIEACVALLPDDLLLEVLHGFDIETAVGKQLDILGEYVGVDRYYLVDNQAQLLNDEDYRILIKLKAISNTSTLSHKALEESLYDFFGNTVRMDSNGNMEMTYFVPKNKTPIIQAAIQKEVLPKPMGVRCNYIIEYDKKFYGYCTYTNQYAVYKTGFRSYSNPDKVGEVLTYDKRIEF